ncbi:hypothetical protein Lal_00012585 [Lupinus albus]|nr:hypothetical protein Lal_00012585 [Lupinus albus]
MLSDYDLVSGQHLNYAKCRFYTANATGRKISNLTSYLGFLAGKPRKVHLQPIAEWKCMSLSKHEDNSCAYKLANYGVTTTINSCWNNVPNFSEEVFHRNRLGLPNYRPWSTFYIQREDITLYFLKKRKLSEIRVVQVTKFHLWYCCYTVTPLPIAPVNVDLELVALTPLAVAADEHMG